MGEIADMMLDGTSCEGCGEYIGTNAGYAQYCSPECAGDRGAPWDPHFQPEHRCLQCGKRLKSSAGLKQHRRDKHGVPL